MLMGEGVGSQTGRNRKDCDHRSNYRGMGKGHRGDTRYWRYTLPDMGGDLSDNYSTLINPFNQIF